MAAIVDRLKEQIAEAGGETAGIQTIAQAINVKNGNGSGNGEIAKALKKSKEVAAT
jgi:hypothetical protein